MSQEALAKVVQRAISDGAFRRQLSTDPTGALRGFDLTSDETAAIRTADAGRLSALGVDQRMSKAFTLGGTGDAATKFGGTDLAGTYGNAIATGGAGEPGGNALVSGDTRDTDALVSGDSGRSASAVTGGGDGTIGSAVTGGGDATLGSTLTAGDVDGSSELYPSDPRMSDVLASNDTVHTYSGDDLAGPGYGEAVTTGTGEGGSSAPSEADGGPDISQ